MKPVINSFLPRLAKLVKSRIFPLFFFLTVIFSGYYALQGLNGSLMEKYAFRQAQTAITVQYLLKGGPWLRYETPVLGPPWSIPLEFPLYQYLVALFVKLSGYAIEPAARLVGLLLFASALYPFYRLTRSFIVNRSAAYAALLLFCLSPQYLFWSRSVMIESTALSLSLWYLYCIRRWCDRDESSRVSYLLMGLTLVLGVVAAITKVTTFFVYYVIGALFILTKLVELRKNMQFMKAVKINLPFLVVSMVVPVLFIVGWTQYTDHVKTLNPIGIKLLSTALHKHHFGTMAQRFSLSGWVPIISRSLNDLVGHVWLFPLTVALLPFCQKRTSGLVLLLTLLFLLPMLVFTNVFFFHSYYIYANGILLLVAIALVVGDLSSRSTPWFLVSVALLSGTAFFSGKRYLEIYYPMQGNEYRYQEMKPAVDYFTRKDDVLVFFGADWSAEMPYYLERRSLMLPDSLVTPEIRAKAVEQMKPYPVGGVVLCLGYKIYEESRLKALADFQSHFPYGFETVSFQNCDFYFQPKGGRL